MPICGISHVTLSSWWPLLTRLCCCGDTAYVPFSWNLPEISSQQRAAAEHEQGAVTHTATLGVFQFAGSSASHCVSGGLLSPHDFRTLSHLSVLLALRTPGEKGTSLPSSTKPYAAPDIQRFRHAYW